MTREKISAAQKRSQQEHPRHHSNEVKNKISIGNLGKSVSLETREKIRIVQTNRSFSHSEKLTQSLRNHLSVKCSCIFCKVECNINNFYRWHNGKCQRNEQ